MHFLGLERLWSGQCRVFGKLLFQLRRDHSKPAFAPGSLLSHSVDQPKVALPRLPAIYFFTEFVRSGGLLSYGSDLPDMYRRAATYMNKYPEGQQPRRTAGAIGGKV